MRILQILQRGARFLFFGFLVYLSVSFWPILNRETVHEVQGELEPPTSGVLNLTPTPRPQGSVKSSFLQIVRTGPALSVKPVNREAAIVIEKIGVNSPIVLDVAVDNPTEYEAALSRGVAHARGTSKPVEQPSNVYLFAHSTANEANIARYAAVFTKLYQLPLGERITLFYRGKRFDYRVIKQEVVSRFQVNVLERKYDFPALTLQTCDPPGKEINRRLVIARLVGVYDE